MVRVLKATLEERIGKNLPVDHPLWTWLPRHAAACLSRYRIGSDGRTAEQRRTGRAWAKAAVEFGERIHARPAVAQEPRSGFAPKMVESRYVGHQSRTGSLLVMTETGVIRGKAFNRMQEDERWTSEGLDDLKGVPWQMVPPAAGSTAPAPAAGSSAPARAPPLAAGAEAAAEAARPPPAPHPQRRWVEAQQARRGAEVPAPPAGGSAADASGAPGQAGVLRGPPGLAEGRPAAKRRVDQMPTALDRAARKRPPEDPPDDPRLETADDDVIVPPAVQAQAAASAGASASSSAVPAAGSPAPAPAAGSSAPEGPDVAMGSFSARKEELRRMYESRIVEAYRANCVDLSSSELDDVTQMALELGAVEVPDAYPGEHAGRSTPAGNVGLRPGVCMNMECPRPDGTKWDFAREEHVSEWFETLEREDPYIEGDGRKPFVRTQTSFMTNLPELAAELRKQSAGGKGGGQPRAQETRVTVRLEGGLVRRSHMLTPVLTQCVLRAIRESMGADGEMSDLAAATAGPVPVGPEPFEAGRENLSDDERYWDDVNGVWLDPQMVQEARRLEVEWLHKLDVYEKRTIEECRSVTGQPPIKLMWIDTNKGDHEKPNYRSRIVVREKRGKGEEGRKLPATLLFSAMPPLEAVKILGGMMVQRRRSSRNRPLAMRLFDISRALFYGKAERAVYIKLPDTEADGVHCGLLKKSMYGTQDASAIWQRDYTAVMEADGHKPGKTNPALFYNMNNDSRSLVHGDDFCALGDEEALDELEKTLRSKCDLKVTGSLQLGARSDQEVVFLSRILRVAGSPGDERFEVEADPRHAEMIVAEMGLAGERTKVLDTPGLKKEEAEHEERETSPLLTGDAVKQYRSVTMRAAYLSPDRADIGDAVKNLAKYMQSPRQVDAVRLKRLARYLKGRPRVVQKFTRDRSTANDEVVKMLIMVDSDNAEDKVSRRSTVGQVAFVGKHVVKHMCNILQVIGLSSGENEYYAISAGVCTGLGIKGILEDWNVACELKDNRADLLTKPFTKREMEEHMKRIHQEFREGRAQSGLRLF
ncbi:unnamed protein product [Prorocentrum cordatum]|uniref:Reverse transcriptase Ty1/copia-type domain-containing protein n=1 Tax=Prorocentrum cordatum TaxID=2364126 RepID=A0ABN9WMJ3_9DINO|nr:unnamed protein product [Polarella glacialis]